MSESGRFESFVGRVGCLERDCHTVDYRERRRKEVVIVTSASDPQKKSRGFALVATAST